MLKYVGVIFFILVIGYFVLPPSCRWPVELSQSQALIEKIETFYGKENRLPTEQEVITIKQQANLPLNEQCPCYQIKTAYTYEVWFGINLGSSYVFDSATRQWGVKY